VGLAAVLLPVAAIALALGVGVIAAPAVALCLAALVTLWVQWSRVQTSNRQYEAALGSYERSSTRKADATTGVVWARLAAIRRSISDLELPDAAAVDVRALLRDIESQVLSLERVSDSASAALDGVDISRLRTRLAALNNRARLSDVERTERDRLTRTRADIDAVIDHSQARRDEVGVLADALDEVAGVLAQLEVGADEIAMARLVEATTDVSLSRSRQAAAARRARQEQ